MPKAKTFGTSRALRWLAERAMHHPDPKERESARVILCLFHRAEGRVLTPGDFARRAGALRGTQVTAAKARARAAAVREVAQKLRDHGVPDEELVDAVRDAWREQGMAKPVPSARTVERALDDD